jgi:excisionase family DNA binding protein
VSLRPLRGVCDMERLLTADEVAAFLQVPRATLYAWRYQGKGPPAIRVGRYLRYRSADIETWISENHCLADRCAP